MVTSAHIAKQRLTYILLIDRFSEMEATLRRLQNVIEQLKSMK